MKKQLFSMAMLVVLTMGYGCQSEKKEDNQSSDLSTETSSETKVETPTTQISQPKTYTVTATPDTVTLGKKGDAHMKIKDLSAIELSDPDGKVTGMELTYKLELTNKNAIGGQNIGVNTSDFRLELDNGQKVAPSSVFVAADAEETKTSDADKFTVPAGAKPTGLSLYLEGTRATLKLDLK